MDSGLVVMSRREMERAHVMRAIEERRLTQKQAATQLRLSVRQVERLYARYTRDGPDGLISRRRGQRNHTLPKALREEELSLVRHPVCGFRSDVGAREAPRAARSSDVGRDATPMDDRRRHLEDPGAASQTRPAATLPSRVRRAVQIDRCEHHWFEEPRPRSACCGLRR